MTNTKRDEHCRDQVVADNLRSNVSEHERAKSKTLIMKTTTRGKEVEAVHFDGR